MPEVQSSDVKLEIGHVLFIDIVGYSKLLISEQGAQIQKLKEIVRNTEQFRLAQAEGKLLRLPTGDGGALVFRTTPEAPVLCALEIAKELRKHPELKVRMGIHSGPVNEITDLNEQANIAGAGVNIAQRVMDCGDAEHILLSKHVAEDLEHYPRWQPYLHDIGECEVKHGGRVSVVNFYTDEVGNPALPEKFRSARKPVAEARRTRARWVVTVAIGIGALAAVAILAWLIVLGTMRSHQKAKRVPVAMLPVPAKSIAVLPFENLSEDKANGYFADGIQDEILTKLAGIGDLKVISRSSTAKYKSKPKDLKTVAGELGVATVLEGTVQRAGDKVRVNVQLLDARIDSHLWAKSYDRDLKDVFAVESEVAQEIADILRAKLSASQADALVTAPTSDAEAYDLFLKGEYEEHQAENALNTELFARAQMFYQQSLARDPNFALAYARLAYSKLYQHWFINNLTSAELAGLKPDIDRALAIAPALPDAHLALAVFNYWGLRDYDAALRELDRTVALQPSNANARTLYGGIYRRRGEWQRALAEFKRAAELNPRDSENAAEIGITYTVLRRWSDAEHELAHALALDPHNVVAASVLAFTYINGAGNIARARQAFEGVPPERKITPLGVWGVIAGMVEPRIYLDVFERHFADALKDWDMMPTNVPDARLRQLEAQVGIQVLADQRAAATSDCEQIRALLEARLVTRAEDRNSLTALAWAYVCLGRDADALRVAQQASDSLPIEKDAVAGAGFLAGLAEIEARTGRAKEAIKVLRQLITIPAGQFVSLARLKIDPVWDPIRNDPDFQRLISGPEPETVYK